MNKLTKPIRTENRALATAAIALSLCSTAPSVSTAAPPTKPACAPVSFESTPYVVCAFNPASSNIKLFLTDPDGNTFGQFSTLATALKAKGKTLMFAMNAGMYHPNRNPVGLYIDGDRTKFPVNTDEGAGNFFMKPNGVFYIDNHRAGVLETTAFLKKRISPDIATQSGPLLVADGKLHPAFRASSHSRHRRNGVGVSHDGAQVFFAISDEPVNLHTFARFFRDNLKTPNALYFDGVISSLYAPQLNRNDEGTALGPIIGVLE